MVLRARDVRWDAWSRQTGGLNVATGQIGVMAGHWARMTGLFIEQNQTLVSV